MQQQAQKETAISSAFPCTYAKATSQARQFRGAATDLQAIA
jgi:hypothetical protein